MTVFDQDTHVCETGARYDVFAKLLEMSSPYVNVSETGDSVGLGREGTTPCSGVWKGTWTPADQDGNGTADTGVFHFTLEGEIEDAHGDHSKSNDPPKGNSDSDKAMASVDLTKYSARITIFRVIEIKTKRYLAEEWDSGTTSIAAGHVVSPKTHIHEAKVEITVDPAVEGIEVPVRLEAGRYYEGSDAELTLNKQPVKPGDPIQKIATDAEGKLQGVLLSSDVRTKESKSPCVITACSLTKNVDFVWDNWDEDVQGTEWISESDVITPGGQSEEHVWFALDTVPLDGHDIRFYVEKVVYIDEAGERQTRNNTPDDVNDLSDYAYFAPHSTTTSEKGMAKSTLHMKDPAGKSVILIEMAAYDFSAAIVARTAVTRAARAPAGDGSSDEERKDHEPKKEKAEPSMAMGFIQRWVYIPVAVSGQNPNPKGKEFIYEVFVHGAKEGEDNKVVWGAERRGEGDKWTESKEVTLTKGNAKKATAWGKAKGAEEATWLKGATFPCEFLAHKPGVYRLTFKYKNEPAIKQSEDDGARATTAIGASIVTVKEKNWGMLVDTREATPTRYGILPFKQFSTTTQQDPDKTPLEDLWELQGSTTGNKIPKPYFSKRKGAHSVEFGNFVTISVAKNGTEGGRVKQLLVVAGSKAANEGNGALSVSKTKGLFYMDGSGIMFRKDKDGGGPPGEPAIEGTDSSVMPLPLPATQTQDVAGQIDPFYLIVPNLDIGSPHGDPTVTTTAGVDGANATNEQIFDDQVPKGEPAGQCAFDIEAAALKGLDKESKGLVWARCQYTIPDVGGQKPGYKPADATGKKVTVTYSKMPAKHDGFGKKQIKMVLGKKPWAWYQHVEFFFHIDGTGGRAGKSPVPNWLFYWSQIEGPSKATGAPGVPTLGVHPNPPANDIHINITKASAVRLSLPDCLAGYVGILAHEMKHEKDFYEVIWNGGGYQAAQDRDGDTLSDEWERRQEMDAAKKYGPWTFDVPADPNAKPPKPPVKGTDAKRDGDVAFESYGKIKSWSDDRADEAAVKAVNANLGINIKDWSDLKFQIPPNTTRWEEFYDEDRRSEARKSKPLTSGNNKHH